ncbi:vacuolar protein sorting-associated protein 53 homolog [Anopheles gambiae]|uniref:Vacuolar protein sorting-associated protein 53 homolog n=1 Tax=Anopheles coluzzii TaxID=1518534 RepID=A0A6E8VQ45_ANOCL|nr:vacuolar protein sorting-associated protein 53 homolog [Anopheles coluzzii]XP_316653.5 vacuolar protein sorting-associated protein 53 homolog [Anopheles gambiae]
MNLVEQEHDAKKDHINEIVLSEDVQRAIEQVLQSSDPLDQPDFNPTDYINQLFPNEQSLSNIDEVIAKMECDISLIDDNIRSVVRGQVNTGENGRVALKEAQQSLTQLFSLITDIKSRAEKTEDAVKEITRDIKQLDSAKNNLTYAITTLNHLHMLVGGVENLKRLSERRQYGEVLNPLQAIIEVNQHFQQYSEIAQIQTLSAQVQQIQSELATQITDDFKNFFSPTSHSNANRMTLTQLKDACQVASVLDKPVKKNILKWFINLQLQEYVQLFHENQDIAWLDKIDKRYAWVKRHLLDFEEKYGTVFPPDWEVSERITVQFCTITREELAKIVARRRTEIDVKLLLFAIQKTANFEQLLDKRFNGTTLVEATSEEVRPERGSFSSLIGSCFKPYLDIYTDSIDRELTALIEQFAQANQQMVVPKEINPGILPNCADLFVFYKKCMVQCMQLSNEKPMYDLVLLFKKYLREYAAKVLEARIPKPQPPNTTTSSISSSMSLLTKDFQNLSTAAGQVIHNFLKEGETPRFSSEDMRKICYILATAEYCLETVQQLEDKLKEKIDKQYVAKVDLSDEKDVYHRIISNCIQLLVHDLDAACEQSLLLMTKIAWHSISNVGDQSGFVNQIITNLKQTVPVIRDNLANSRKYYTQFCHKFVNSFIPKYINTLYRLRPTSSGSSSASGTAALVASASSSSLSEGGASGGAASGGNILGCEQLLLDTHSLKTVLMDLPSIGSQVQRKPPASYTKVVVKGMAKAEMIIKVVMQPVHPASLYIEQYLKLMPESSVVEFHKILEMKNVRKIEQQQLVEAYKRACPQLQQQPPTSSATAGSQAAGAESGNSTQQSNEPPTSGGNSTQSQQIAAAAAAISGAGSSIMALGDSLMDKGRIKKIENLIKNRLPN